MAREGFFIFFSDFSPSKTIQRKKSIWIFYISFGEKCNSVPISAEGFYFSQIIFDVIWIITYRISHLHIQLLAARCLPHEKGKYYIMQFCQSLNVHYCCFSPLGHRTIWIEIAEAVNQRLISMSFIHCWYVLLWASLLNNLKVAHTFFPVIPEFFQASLINRRRRHSDTYNIAAAKFVYL